MSYRTSRSFERNSVEERVAAITAALNACLPVMERGLHSALKIYRTTTPEGKALRLFEDVACVFIGFVLARLLA